MTIKFKCAFTSLFMCLPFGCNAHDSVDAKYVFRSLNVKRDPGAVVRVSHPIGRLEGGPARGMAAEEAEPFKEPPKAVVPHSYRWAGGGSIDSDKGSDGVRGGRGGRGGDGGFFNDLRRGGGGAGGLDRPHQPFGYAPPPRGGSGGRGGNSGDEDPALIEDRPFKFCPVPPCPR